MKRLFHILIPLLLSLLILISIGWYFLKYDPEFTRDILLSQARYQDEIGNHSAAEDYLIEIEICHDVTPS